MEAEGIWMESNTIAAALQRLMYRVDYYLHCELDGEYEHEKPEQARMRLEHALREELLKAHAEGLVAGIRGATTSDSAHHAGASASGAPAA